MKTVVQISRCLALVGLLFAGVVQAQEYNAPEADGQGVIQGLDFGSNSAVVDGTDYRVSPNVQVEIGGSYGAFTMLHEGMSVVFTYLHYSNGVREIIQLQEVAAVEGI